MPPTPHRVFLLSPAHCGGKRASFLFNEAARFELARKVQTPQGAPIGDVFSFLSGLYFRGKLAYARAFASPPPGTEGAFVITTNRGFVPPDTYVSLSDLREMGCVDIDDANPNYRGPLGRDAAALAARAMTVTPQGGAETQFILLGSVATGKYVDVLLEALGQRLFFPSEFVGRGDMSRGGLMLRCVADGRELSYVPVAGAVRHGQRPPRLERPGFVSEPLAPRRNKKPAAVRTSSRGRQVG